MKSSRTIRNLCNDIIYCAHKSWHSKQGGLPFRELLAQPERLSDQSGGLAVICSAISMRVPRGWSKMHHTLPGKTHEVCVSSAEREENKDAALPKLFIIIYGCIIAPINICIGLVLLLHYRDKLTWHCERVFCVWFFYLQGMFHFFAFLMSVFKKQSFCSTICISLVFSSSQGPCGSSIFNHCHEPVSDSAIFGYWLCFNCFADELYFN